MTVWVRGECNTVCFVFSGHQQVLQRSDIECDYNNSKPALGAIKSHKTQPYDGKSLALKEIFYSLLSKFLYILYCQRVEKLRINRK